MPCGGQATYDGDEIFIECDGDWDCCQREQAKAKVDNYNSNLPLSPQGVSTAATNAAKGTTQKAEWEKMEKDMKADPKAGAKKWATSPCQADKLEQDWNAGKRDRTALGINMDHQVEVKYGGHAQVALKALDKRVNLKFGTKAKELANNIGCDIQGVYLICPNTPPCTPPPKPADFSTAPKGKANRSSLPTPAHGFITPKG